MSTISTILSNLRSAVWAIDVRDEIANAIEQCYKDVNSPSLVTDGIEEVIGDMVDNGRISGAIVEDLGLITEGTSNLFDFTTVTAGRLNTSTGEVGEASGYWTSDFIPVENGKTYYFANTDRRVAYNSSKAYSANISGTTWTASANGYVRVSVTSANRKTAKINEGSAKDYRPGRSPIDFNLRDDVYRKDEVDAALAAVTIATDPELETAGAAADAKATGDAISALNESLNGLNAGTRLDMLVTMREVIPEDDEEGIVQLVDLNKAIWGGSAGSYSVKLQDNLRLRGDGGYFVNPFGDTTNAPQAMFYAKFLDIDGNVLTLTRDSNGATSEFLTMSGNERMWAFFIENGNTIKYYVKYPGLTRIDRTDKPIAYIQFGQNKQTSFGYFNNNNIQFGLTYGGSSDTYVPYAGGDEAPVYEYQYTTALAEYVQDYAKKSNGAVSNKIFDVVYPEKDNSESVNAFKYFLARAERTDKDIIRVANLNKYISLGTQNWREIKQELSDYSIDICGFEEVGNSVNAKNQRIEEFLQSYQFTSGSDFPLDGVVPGKALVSHWNVESTEILSLVTTDDRGTQYALKCTMKIPSGRWENNFVDTTCTLSVYVWHGIAYNASVDGTGLSSREIRLMEIAALTSVMNQDTSDFIIVVSDSNCFESGFNTETGTHVEWEAFRVAGYTPVLDGLEGTVTNEPDARHFHEVTDGTVYCISCYDQIFISSNIEAIGYKVIDSHLYPVEYASNAPISDHCMVYADLKLDFDAVIQNKLKAALSTT